MSSRSGPNVLVQDVRDGSIRLPVPDRKVEESFYVSKTDSKLASKDLAPKEMETGHCATCGSTVKWPKHLSVFRCTICLMVNDIRQSGIESWAESENRTDEKQPLDPILSLRRAEIMIDRCIRLYLQSRLIPGHEFQSKCAKKPRTGCSSDCGRGSDLQQDSATPLPNFGRNDNNMLKVDYTRCDHLQDGEGQAFRADVPTLSSSLPTSHQRLRPNSGDDAEALPGTSTLMLSTTQSISQPPEPRGSTLHQTKENINSPLVFLLLEHYIICCFRNPDCLNASFTSHKRAAPARSVSEDTTAAFHKAQSKSDARLTVEEPFEMDAKTLLLGDVAENGTWWLGNSQTDLNPPSSIGPSVRTTSRLTKINWVELHSWYQVILGAGRDWRTRLAGYLGHASPKPLLTVEKEAIIEAAILESRKHLHRTLLKASETLLRRPGRPFQTAEDCRFLLLLATNPLLHHHGSIDDESGRQDGQARGKGGVESPPKTASSREKGHTGIVKRILGLMANLSQANHRCMINWLAQCPHEDFQRLVDLVNRFVTHRLMRQRGKLQGAIAHEVITVLVPEISTPGVGGSAQLHAALGTRVKSVSTGTPPGTVDYREDWQVKVAAKVMSLLFLANNSNEPRLRGYDCSTVTRVQHSFSQHRGASYPMQSASTAGSKGRSGYSSLIGRDRAQMLPVNAFYNTFLDYRDLVADFEAWETRRGVFSFCQYPMFFSIWAKIQILEYDTRRQMEIKARQAFFSSIMSRHAESQYLVLKVRRDCLVEDSLHGVSEVVGSGQEDIKKGLRIAFAGEEGVDAGGLRKEWFLLLVREVFDPAHGLFVYDDDSHYCYFNPNTFETSDQFFLVGVVLGLAIYNSTILDVALPPFLYRKLLASGPCYAGSVTSTAQPAPEYTLVDLGEFQPSLASGLRQLLEYDGDVEEAFCHDFVVESDRYGQSVQVPLCPNGEKKALTSNNRGEFVKLYVRYLLDTSVSRQFEPFKRGFFSVCGGNALSLFRAEEIELLVRGSEEQLDVGALRAVAIYDGWEKKNVVEEEAVVKWFWDLFSEADAKQQRALLCFITGSDRLPAVGATSLIIKISCLGNEVRRFPMARTCFNMIGLYQYASKEALQGKLWRAVAESQGFGLK
ncbi:MAG: hypothetical protein Q9218_000966 [Villophora microphyllina]